MKVICTTAIFLLLFMSTFCQVVSTLDGTDKAAREKPVASNNDESTGRRIMKREATTKANFLEEWTPIRILPIYYLSKRLCEEEKLALKSVLKRAILKIKTLLSVKTKGQKHYLLKRKHACSAVIKKGKNKGKCSKLQKGYTGEVCMDNFKLPSNHLEGLAIFNNSHPLPVKVYKTHGRGVNNIDFVLYVTSKTTVLCNPQKSSAFAYASACQLDHKGRPVAGQVNFCPRTLKAQKFDEELTYKTAIHELFHALGFSTKLFDRFVSCHEDGKCNRISHNVVETIKGIPRLITPAVVREMRSHFHCLDQLAYGAPLQMIDGKISSHWDPILMHSSIMTAREQKPYLTLIDKITLAVFEDSGWYKVNYSQADPFIWGKGQGCGFGLQQECDAHNVLCSDNSTGCHHLRLSKAKCNANPDLPFLQCGVFAADQRPCFTEISKMNSLESDTTETFSEISRCFLSSLIPHNSTQNGSNAKMNGKCYESKCDGEEVFVRIAGGEWLPCPFGSKIQVENFHGSIECPSQLELCTSFVLRRSASISDVNVVQINQYKEGGSSFDTLTTTTEKAVKRRKLFGTISISSICKTESEKADDVIMGVIKEHGIRVERTSSLTGKCDVRLCYIMLVRVDSDIDRFKVEHWFKAALSSAFNGTYDRRVEISVLTASYSYCGRRLYYFDKYGRRIYKGRGASLDTTMSLIKVVTLQSVWFLIWFL